MRCPHRRRGGPGTGELVAVALDEPVRLAPPGFDAAGAAHFGERRRGSRRSSDEPIARKALADWAPRYFAPWRAGGATAGVVEKSDTPLTSHLGCGAVAWPSLPGTGSCAAVPGLAGGLNVTSGPTRRVTTAPTMRRGCVCTLVATLAACSSGGASQGDGMSAACPARLVYEDETYQGLPLRRGELKTTPLGEGFRPPCNDDLDQPPDDRDQVRVSSIDGVDPQVAVVLSDAQESTIYFREDVEFTELPRKVRRWLRP